LTWQENGAAGKFRFIFLSSIFLSEPGDKWRDTLSLNTSSPPEHGHRRNQSEWPQKNTKNAERRPLVFVLFAFSRGKNLRKKTKLFGIVVQNDTKESAQVAVAVIHPAGDII